MDLGNILLKKARLALALLLIPGASFASDIGTPDMELLKGLYPGKTFSPYAPCTFPSNVYWGDPEFDPDLKAFYYARILEIPTPRWILNDKLRFGADIPEAAKLVHQERAYTSPIWYSPGG